MRTRPSAVSSGRPQHELPVPLQPGQCAQQGVDRRLSERGARREPAPGTLSLQCAVVVGRGAGTQAHPQRGRGPACPDGCTPHHNTVDVPTLFWASIPGNEADFPAEESFHTFLDRPFASLRPKRTTAVRPRPSESRWWTVLRAYPYTWTSSDEPMRKGVITTVIIPYIFTVFILFEFVYK